MHRTGDKVLLKNGWKTKSNQDALKCPYTVTEAQNNGIICTRKGNTTDIYNLRNIMPFNK